MATPAQCREIGRLGGRPKGSKNRSTLAREELQELHRRMLFPYIEQVISALITKATEGDVTAIKEYLDRLIGKVPSKDSLVENKSVQVILTEYNTHEAANE